MYSFFHKKDELVVKAARHGQKTLLKTGKTKAFAGDMTGMTQLVVDPK